ncbi:MBL fold metallo-hydrolase [Nocardioides agariphilus]|uniref:MBL fold metallo-hydrolase n=1 Tax=Nocardioides agariphilus TaxID=433664 RepID=A0A930VH50_9ACTN|nr:MBL fold metallo-hydrolase [Nocardioides agariphilus]
MAGFIEVADRVWVARYPWLDVNVTAVAGDAGLLVLDTQASAALAREMLVDLRHVTALPIMWAVDSHEHWDHTFGNGVLRSEGAELICHENAAESLPAHAAEVRANAVQETEPQWADVAATEVVVPERTFSSAIALDLGNRQVELVHPGRGHTGGDLVVRVPDADVLLAGDLVEDGNPPAYGSDSYPMDWPLTLDVVLGLTTTASVVVPGHGAVVDREFVEVQRNEIGIVAETIRDLATRGVAIDDALAAAEWPYPERALVHAVRRGYEHLPRSQKRLPLV